MKTLRKFGFFSSRGGDRSLREAVRPIQSVTDPSEDKILAYLEAGHPYLMDAGIARDLIDSQHPVIGVPNVMTDGEWAWTQDVMYYIRKYHIRVPSEFIAHMEGNRWMVPKVNDFKQFTL